MSTCDDEGHLLGVYGACIREGCTYRDEKVYQDTFPGLGVGSVSMEEREASTPVIVDNTQYQFADLIYGQNARAANIKMWIGAGNTEDLNSPCAPEPKQTRDEAVAPYSDIPPCALRRLAKIYKEGRIKYGHIWLNGLPWSETFDHLQEHLEKWLEGNTEEDHLAKVAWAAFSLMYYEEHHPGNDDRLFTQNSLNSTKEATTG
jgi:hypothetical protein